MTAQRQPGNGHRHIRTLHLKLPASLWAALEERRRLTGEPIDHIVRAALADALQVEHHTLYQVSTSTALVEGICRGRDLRVQLQEVRDLRVALPANEEFLRADLTRDPAADLARAE